MSKREVYIGNNITIEVEPNEEVIKVFDFDKLNEYIKKYGEIEAGMKTDWKFTATTIRYRLFPATRDFLNLRFYRMDIPVIQKYVKHGWFINSEAPPEVQDLYDRIRNDYERKLYPFKVGNLVFSDWDTPVIYTDETGFIDCYFKARICKNDLEFWFERE